ncbi:MAG: hypothetical protein AB1422_16690 [bacterium]
MQIWCPKGDKEIKGEMEIIHCNLQNFRMNLSPYLHNPHISFSYTISTCYARLRHQKISTCEIGQRGKNKIILHCLV